MRHRPNNRPSSGSSSSRPQRKPERPHRGPAPAAAARPPQTRPARSSEAAAGDFYPRAWRAIVGHHAIREALAMHPEWIEALWLQQGWETNQDLKTLQHECRAKVTKIEVKPEAVLERLAHSHQGAALFLNQAPKVDWENILLKPSAKVLVLDGIEDPHNLGAILRTAWLLRVDAVLLPQDRAVRLTPVVHKVACGGVEHVPIEICGQFGPRLQELKDAGFWIFGLSHKGSQSIFQMKLPNKIAWCIGAEDKGLRTTTERLCDELVAIPQADAAASYNASVATSMALFETHRQVMVSLGKELGKKIL